MSARRVVRGGAVLLVGAVLLLASLPVGAQYSEGKRGWGRKEEKPPEEERRPVLSGKNLERINRAYEDIFEQRYDDAKQELDKSYFSRMNVVEKAKFHEAYALIAIGMEDREEARRRFQAAIDVPDGLLRDGVAEARFRIAQLWMQDEEWKQAADTFEQWLTEVKKPNAASFYLLAICYHQLEDYAKALPYAEKAVELGNPPQEGWLQLLLAIHLFQSHYAEAVPVLEQMVARFPKKQYFLNLATVHGALGNYEDAGVPLQLAYEQGLLEQDSEIERLGQMLLYLELPYRAGEVLENAIEAGEIEPDVEVLSMLSNAWIAAREYDDAIDPLERAAGMASDGDLYLRLAQVHVQRENWDGATEALRQALDKGDLKEPGNAHLLMGIAFFSQGRAVDAQRWFESATRYDPVRQEAQVWLSHLAQEVAAGG